MTIWNPSLSGEGAIYRQVAEAIANAIESGELQPGQKLPTHRALADQLGVTVGTITRAYSEAEHQGWLTARIGAGTYVKDSTQEPGLQWHIRQPNPDRIELWQNLPILQDKQEAFRNAIHSIIDTPGKINSLMEYSSVNGEVSQREIVCEWLSHYGYQVSVDDLFFNYGAQNGLLLSLMACGAVGETILCEGLIYPGLMTLCHTLRIQPKGLEIDEEGLIPEALEKACLQGNYRTLYLNPTIHNPTTAIMSLARRKRILEICQKYKITIIEDDVHGMLPESRPPALVTLAPQQVIHVGSFAKNTSAGLRFGYMIVPKHLQQAMSVAVRGTSWMITPLMIELTCQWLITGQAEKMLLNQRQILKQRGELLRHHLRDYEIRYSEGSMHAWLTLPPQWRVQSFVQHADAAGIGLASGDLFTAGNYPAPHAVRLSISHPASNTTLDQALTKLKTLLKSEPSPHWII